MMTTLLERVRIGRIEPLSDGRGSVIVTLQDGRVVVTSALRGAKRGELWDVQWGGPYKIVTAHLVPEAS